MSPTLKLTLTFNLTLSSGVNCPDTDNETANIKNPFFSNIVINLNVPKYHDCEGISGIISNPILKVIVKKRSRDSIKAIKRVFFSVDIVDREKILQEISSLDHKKPCHELDIPTKIFKENAEIFQNFFISRLMLQAMEEPFHQFSNWLMLPQFLQKVQRTLKIFTEKSAF